MSQGSNPKPKTNRIQIELSPDLKSVYANVPILSMTPAEVVLDFAQVLPRTPKGKIMARVVMSPIYAKVLMNVLNQNIANYEKQYGEIKIPQQPHLADQLFKFPPPNDNGENEKSE